MSIISAAALTIITSHRFSQTHMWLHLQGLPSVLKNFPGSSGIHAVRPAHRVWRIRPHIPYLWRKKRLQNYIHPAICRSPRRDRKHCRSTQVPLKRLRHPTDFSCHADLALCQAHHCGRC